MGKQTTAFVVHTSLYFNLNILSNIENHVYVEKNHIIYNANAVRISVRVDATGKTIQKDKYRQVLYFYNLKVGIKQLCMTTVILCILSGFVLSLKY